MAIRPRNDPVRLFWRRLLLLGLFVLVVASALGVWSAYGKEQESAQLRHDAEAQLQDLTTRQAQLQTDIGKLQTDRGKEEVLREQYALAGKGEGLIVIVDPTPTEPVATSSAFAQWLHKTFPWW
jgi:cell division protein FtsB